jgi:hypothetical protein
LQTGKNSRTVSLPISLPRALIKHPDGMFVNSKLR